MSLDDIQSFLTLALGFAVAGVLTTGYQALTARAPSFGVISRGPGFRAFAAVPFLMFAAPFIIMRNTIRARQLAEHRFATVMLATTFAGFWSLMSGTALIMALGALGVA
jgi:hypothetical protein